MEVQPMHAVKFSLFLPTGDFAEARAAAEWADAHGFDAVSMNDHFFSPLGSPETPQLECFTTLAAIAAVTKRVRLMPTVAAMSFRNPAQLAKTASTLDVISHGRLVLGVGAGWQRNEYDAHGYPYPSNAERLDQLREGIAVLKAMWTQQEPTFRGRHFAIDKAYNHPRPVQKPHPPIMVGGSGEKLLPITAAAGDLANLIPPIYNGKDLIQDPAAAVRFDKALLGKKIARLRRLAQDAGRDPKAIEIGGLSLVSVAAEKRVADAAARTIASSMGFPSDDDVRRSPSLLIGTPDEVTREIRSRVDELGVTYFVVFATSTQARELFAKEVMPAFESKR
jgi:probable F420-dependent oxidoreductase